MGASERVPEKGANLLGDFRAQGMLDLAGVFVQQILIEAEGLIEEPFGEAMAADNFLGAPLLSWTLGFSCHT